MGLRLVLVGLAVLASMIALGCGSTDATKESLPVDSGSGGEDASGQDSGAAVDSAMPVDARGSVYPAFVPDIGQIQNQGGMSLSAPQIATVTWSTDTTAPALQDFGDKIGSSAFWGLLSEYMVGPATSGPVNHVVITAPAQSPWDDTEIESWAAAQVNDPATSMWPAANAQTIYMIYTPPSVHVTSQGGAACDSYGGYHTQLQDSSNPNIVYALVVGECAAGSGSSLQDNDTEGASHEIVEAATDPLVETSLAWAEFDEAHWAWEIFLDGQDEVADACENYPDSYYTDGADLPYAVQRFWSNKSAAAGHNPCVPAETGAYFNVTPLMMTEMTVSASSPSLSPMNVTTKGYRIAPGQSATFQVGLYSDAPTKAWEVRAYEGDSVTTPTTPVLTLSTDKSTGNNGDVINVTVKVAASSSRQKGVLMTLISTQGETQHDMPILIGTY